MHIESSPSILLSLWPCRGRPRRYWPAIVALALACSGLTGRGQISHVVQVSLDGLGAKYLEFYLSDAPEEFPNFVRLTSEGAYTMNARCDFDISETVPNHATMFTARPVFQPEGWPDTTHHGYNNNFPGPNDTLHANGNPSVPYKASFFDVAHDHGLTTAFYAGKTRLAVCERSYNELNGMLDLLGEDDGRDKIDFASVTDTSGAAISDQVTLLVEDLQSALPAHYSFIHIAEPDLTGHANNWGSANWSNMVRLVDLQVGRILEAIQANPVLSNRTALIVTADHGGGGVRANAHTEAYHITNYTIPFFLWGPEVPAATDLYTLMSNRKDPGPERTDYAAVPQPIRDGDAGNLGLSLLGLPPIPGSFMIPELALTPLDLAYDLRDNLLILSWPASRNGYVLETSSTFARGQWNPILEEIQAENDQRVWQVDLTETTGPAYFRLRRRGIRFLDHPQSRMVHPWDAVVFEAGAEGSGHLQFQWRRNGADLPGETDATLVIDPVELGDEGDYQAVVTDGLDTVTSAVAVLTILLDPTITAQPQSQTVNRGSDVTLSVTAVGSGLVQYQWMLNGRDIPGANASTLALTGVQVDQAGAYIVVVTDDYGFTASEVATVNVIAPVTIVQQPQSQAAKVGDDVTFTVVIDGYPPPFGYRWRRGFVAAGYQQLNTTTSSFTLTNVQLNQAGNYSVIITNLSTPFPGVTSMNAALTVNE